ncbi:hypothetical protein BH10ACT8_BH10ACT8_19420 [soil metagenome]|jgi:hypothetical protein
MSAPAASSQVLALDTSQVKNLGIVAIVAVLVIGLAVSYFVSKIVTKIVTIVVVVIVGFALYNQRQKVVDALDKSAKKCDVTFFGVHVQPSDPTIRQACAAVAKQQGK